MMEPNERQVYSADPNERVQRDQAAMVMRSLEQCLGRMFRSLATEGLLDGAPGVKNILSRETEKGRAVAPEDFDAIVQATYLDELLSLSIKSTANRSENAPLRRLQELFGVLQVYEIRNAIAHPNRPFPEFYWYRIKAIAGDPVIEQLGYEDVRQSLAHALAGRIVLPPDEWLAAPLWVLPNNLPEHFDHSITGLIGRNKELQNLKEQIRNPRYGLLALISPGGLGKTALLLEALREISRSPESLTWTDKIFFASSKTERLTVDGVEEVRSTASTLDALRAELISWLSPDAGSGEQAFDAIVSHYSETRMLLCFDNLETLLRDSAQEFRDFYRSLPPNWRVVVTSRVPVPSAEPIPLLQLEERGARELAVTYLRRRGMQPRNSDDIDLIVNACDRNPLAIRLAIDTYRRGGTLEEVVLASKQQVVEFSYKSLIETLHEIERLVLECLFLAPGPLSREQVRDLLFLPLDEIASAFSVLIDTSLVSRHSTQAEDLYSVSFSVRDLLLMYPASPEAHGRIQERMRRIRGAGNEITLLQRERRVTVLDWNYVPDSVPRSLGLLAYEAIKLLGQFPSGREQITGQRRSSLLETTQRLRQALAGNPDSALLHRILGISLIALGDVVRGRESLRYATQDRIFDPAAALFLAHECREENEFVEAVEVSAKLIERGWDEPARTNELRAAEVVKSYWLPKIWMNESLCAIDGTSNWRAMGTLRSTYGTLHAQAWRKLVQYDQGENVEQALLIAAEVLAELVRSDGYGRIIAAESFKLIDQVSNMFKFGSAVSPKGISTFTRFVADHLVNLCNASEMVNLDSEEVKVWLAELITINAEPGLNELQVQNWRRALGWVDIAQDPRHVLAKIYHRPADVRGVYRAFLFAQDETSQQYFVHRAIVQGGARQWFSAKQGDCVLLIPGAKGADQAVPAQVAEFCGV